MTKPQNDQPIAQIYQKTTPAKLTPNKHLHDRNSEITNIKFDHAASVTGNTEDNFKYTIKPDNGKVPNLHFQRHDLKKIEK